MSFGRGEGAVESEDLDPALPKSSGLVPPVCDAEAGLSEKLRTVVVTMRSATVVECRIRSSDEHGYRRGRFPDLL